MSISSVNSSSKSGQEPVFKTAPTNPRVEDIAGPLRPGGENSYLEAYPKDVAFRIKARENFLLPPYKAEFRNLVTLAVPPNMPLEEAELLLHDIAAMTPDQRKKAYSLLRALSSVINEDNYHDLLQTLLSNSGLTDEEEQSFVKAISQMLRQKTPKTHKARIINALFILCEKHPDRIHLVDRLANQAIEPCFIAPILEMMLQSSWPKKIIEIGFTEFLEQLNELANVINPEEFNNSSAENMLITICMMCKMQPEKRDAFLAFAKKRAVSWEILRNVVQLFTFRDYKQLSILDQIMPPQMEGRLVNALIITLTQLNHWESLDMIFPPAKREKCRTAIHALLAQQPDIGTITFKQIVDDLIYSNDPESTIESRLSLAEKAPESVPMPPHPLGEQAGSSKAAVCPFQRMWTLSTASQDPLAVQEILNSHRFKAGVFKVPRFTFSDEKSILRCPPENTPRFRKIFFDLLLEGHSVKRLQLIIQDHFDLLFTQGIPGDSKQLEESLKAIVSCILDETPIGWPSSLEPILDQKKLFESQLYTDLLDAGYTQEEILENFKILAGVTVGNGLTFLSSLLNYLQTGGPEVQDLLVQIRQNVQKKIADKGCGVWEAMEKVKEIDMIILEALRLSPLLSISRNHPDKAIKLNLNLLAGRSDLVGEKPEEFHPTRLEEEGKQRISSYWPSAVPWMPFGHGKHLCPGWRLYQVMSRYLLVKAALATP